MNAKFARLVGLSVAVTVAITMLLLPTLPPSSAAPRQQSDLLAAEPNNTFGSASAIDVGAAIEQTIAPVGDVDWYVFDVDHQGELQLSITNVDTTLAINVRVWNSNKATVSNWFAPLAAGGNTEAIVDLAQAGRYFLEVADGVGNVESNQPYTLETAFTPTADGEQPNDAFGNATPLELAQTVQANILPAGDVDWYSFEVTEHGELSVQISDVAADLAVSFRLWNGNKDTLSGWISPLAQGGDTTGILDLPAAGRYLLEVAGESGERSTQPYALDITFVAAVDGFEPNDSFGTAAPFTLGESVNANILPGRDADWFSVTVDHHGELNVAVTDVPATLAVEVRVWNSNKDTISNWIAPLSVGGETLGSVDLPRAGTYYLEFVETNSARSVEPFSIAISFFPAADAYDNNDTFGTASDLPLGHVAQSNILPRYDTDWQRIVVDHQGELQIVASDVPENLDINFRVWNSNQDVISNWFAPLARGGDTVGVVDLPTAGTYYVEVTDGGGDERSIEPFTLVANFVTAADMGEPNNSAEVATPAALDTTIAANILPANDADWYRVELDDAGDLYVLITNVASNLEVVFRLWNDQGEVISSWVYPLAAGGNTESVFPIAEAGSYLLEVVDNRGGRSIQPYLLRFSLDEIDPAGMTFTQTLTNTQTLEESESTIEAGTEIVTTTTTIVTTTTTIESSGAMSESVVITDTQVMTDTSVVTRTATASTPRTPGAPSTTLPSTTLPSTTITSTATVTESVENTTTPEIPPAEEITTTIPTTETGALLPPVGDATSNTASELPPITPFEATIPEGEMITVEGVVVVLPTGWQAAEEGGSFRGMALNPDDLLTEVPTGPRLWVLAPGAEDLAFSGTLEPAGEAVSIVEGATTFEIGDQTAIAFGVQETFGDQTINRRYVYINTGDGESYEFILESPAEQWAEQVSLLEGILASILIEPS